MPELRMPELLSPGDRVLVVAPAGPVDGTRLDRGMAWLEGLQLRPVEGRSLRRRRGHGLPFLAGDDDDRRSDLVHGLTDPGITAVLAARGGNGTPRLLDDMPWDELTGTEPTIVAGLSDLTCLHQALAANLGWASLWSPMVASPPIAGDRPDEWSRQQLRSALMAGEAEPTVLHGTTSVAGDTVTAPLIGGTLALLSAMIGTPGCMPSTGAILIVEDVGERAYRLERFLTHLRRSGFLDGVRGVAVGDLTDCAPPAEVDRVITDGLGADSGLDVPVVTGLSFGHGRRQGSLWLGRNATLDARAGTLTQPRPA